MGPRRELTFPLLSLYTPTTPQATQAHNRGEDRGADFFFFLLNFFFRLCFFFSKRNVERNAITGCTYSIKRQPLKRGSHDPRLVRFKRLITTAEAATYLVDPNNTFAISSNVQLRTLCAQRKTILLYLQFIRTLFIGKENI